MPKENQYLLESGSLENVTFPFGNLDNYVFRRKKKTVSISIWSMHLNLKAINKKSHLGSCLLHVRRIEISVIIATNVGVHSLTIHAYVNNFLELQSYNIFKYQNRWRGQLMSHHDRITKPVSTWLAFPVNFMSSFSAIIVLVYDFLESWMVKVRRGDLCAW